MTRSAASDEPGGGPSRPYWWEGARPVEPDWRRYLRGGSRAKLHLRLVDGDPLALLPLAWSLQCEAAYLLETERLFLRATAWMAQRGPRYHGKPAFLDWVCDTLEQAMEELLDEDREAELRNLPIDDENRDGFRRLVPREAGLSAGLARRATVVFNALPEERRRPFFHVVVQGLTPEDYAEEVRSSVQAVNESIAAATRAMVDGCEEWPPRFRGPEDLR